MVGALVAALSLQVVFPAPAHIDPARTGVAAVVDSLEAAELRFFYEWNQVFKLSPPIAVPALSQLRDAYVHCHPGRAGKYTPLPEDRVVRSGGGSYYALCPSWSFVDSLPLDERRGIDEALAPRFREAVHRARASVVSLYDAAARSFPSNEWIAGQRVRLLLDQGERDGAVAAARECRGHDAACAALLGYALAERGDIAPADSAFNAASAAMGTDERCRWSDLRLLLDSTALAAYRRFSCAQLDSVGKVVWWLADPLWIEPGNERRVVQLARQVGIALRTSLMRDERYDWRIGAGGDALSEVIARYGWPSYTAWSGPQTDAEHSGFLLSYRTGLNPPYTTFEYAPGRLQTIPEWAAIADPAHAKTTDWAIADPGERAHHYFIVADGAVAQKAAEYQEKVSPWWPIQHFTPRTPLVQLPDGQVAFLRRENGVILATATNLAAVGLAPFRTSPVDATLVVTNQPDSVRVITHTTTPVGSTAVLFGQIDAQPGLAGIEFLADKSARPGGRTRFGIVPPTTLASMSAGDLAISDVVLLTAPAPNGKYPTATEDVLPHMLGTPNLPKGKQLGVYWELYGFSPSDSVELAVWIERITPQGIVRRFGIALNVATDLNTPVAQSWSDPEVGRGAHVIPGAVTIIGRTLTLDASKLPSGSYSLDVVARKPGHEPVHAKRTFVVPQ